MGSKIVGLTFPKNRHLRTKAEFSRAFEVGTKVARGPLVLRACANELGHSRLGLAVPKAVGSAPRRNRIKRMLRESFRLAQHDLPAGLDMVIVVRPHAPMVLGRYQQLLAELVAAAKGQDP